MAVADLRIKMNAVGQGQIWLNDIDISGITTGVEIISHVGDRTQVKLYVLADCEIDIDNADCEIDIDNADKEERETEMHS